MRYVALIVGGDDVMLCVPIKKNKRSYVWDHAGGHLIFRKAGGKISDSDGKGIGSGRTMADIW
jgi:3'(2'), 5'-bisphosphate nucleotidase